MLSFVFLLFSAAYAQNILTQTFELDGDMVEATGDSRPDWVSVFAGTSGAFSWFSVADPSPQSIFTTGGSKDILDIPNWQYKNGNVPPKSDITNAYGAAFSSNKVVVFGADLFADPGDVNLGFWFLQDSVAPNGNGGFTGVHKTGDLLLVCALTNGGTVANIQIYVWNQSGSGRNGPGAFLVQTVNNAKCNPSIRQQACGVVNTRTTTLFHPQQASYSVKATQFFEGAIDLTSIFASTASTGGYGNPAPGPVPCYSSFLAETRASQSVSAVLKDFVASSFELCSATVTFTCAQLVQNYNTFTATATVTVVNTGLATLHINSVTDLTSNPAVTSVTFNPATTSADLAPGATKTYTVVYTLSSPSAFTPKIKVDFQDIDDVTSDYLLVCPFAPNDIAVEKSCDLTAFLTPNQGFQYTVDVSVANIAGPSKTCTLSSPSAGPITVAPLATGHLTFTFTTLSTNPTAPVPTVTCTDSSGNILTKSVTGNTQTCPKVVSSVKLEKNCIGGSLFTAADGTQAFLYNIQAVVSNNVMPGAGEVGAELFNCQITDGLATSITCGAGCPAGSTPPCGTGCTGGIIPSVGPLTTDPASSVASATYTVVQAASVGTITGTLPALTITPSDLPASVSCQDSAGNLVRATAAAINDFTTCAVTFNLGLTITKSCSVALVDANEDVTALHLTITSSGAVTNTGDLTLRNIVVQDTQSGETPAPSVTVAPTSLSAHSASPWRTDPYVPQQLSFTGCLKFSDAVTVDATVPVLAGTLFATAHGDASKTCGLPSPCPQ